MTGTLPTEIDGMTSNGCSSPWIPIEFIQWQPHSLDTNQWSDYFIIWLWVEPCVLAKTKHTTLVTNGLLTTSNRSDTTGTFQSSLTLSLGRIQHVGQIK